MNYILFFLVNYHLQDICAELDKEKPYHQFYSGLSGLLDGVPNFVKSNELLDISHEITGLLARLENLCAVGFSLMRANPNRQDTGGESKDF
jgi:hypothetical protein